MPTYNETNFEDHIEAHLNRSGYRSRQPVFYNRRLCLIHDEMLDFIRATQLKAYQKLERQYEEKTAEKLLIGISKAIECRGVLDVLRNGVVDRGCYVRSNLLSVPASGMNPDLGSRYAQNRFSLIRQLKYSQKNEKSLDMALFLNGLPLVTMELKNSLTGQVVPRTRRKQYRTES